MLEEQTVYVSIQRRIKVLKIEFEWIEFDTLWRDFRAFLKVAKTNKSIQHENDNRQLTSMHLYGKNSNNGSDAEWSSISAQLLNVMQFCCILFHNFPIDALMAFANFHFAWVRSLYFYSILDSFAFSCRFAISMYFFSWLPGHKLLATILLISCWPFFWWSVNFFIHLRIQLNRNANKMKE